MLGSLDNLELYMKGEEKEESFISEEFSSSSSSRESDHEVGKFFKKMVTRRLPDKKKEFFA